MKKNFGTMSLCNMHLIAFYITHHVDVCMLLTDALLHFQIQKKFSLALPLHSTSGTGKRKSAHVFQGFIQDLIGGISLKFIDIIWEKQGNLYTATKRQKQVSGLHATHYSSLRCVIAQMDSQTIAQIHLIEFFPDQQSIPPQRKFLPVQYS